MSKKDIQMKEAKVSVRKFFKESGKIVKDSEIEETVEVFRLDPEVAYTSVSAEKKRTIGLPGYSSVGISVFLSVPCPLEDGQIEAAYTFASNFCGERLSKEAEGIIAWTKSN